MPTTLFVQPSVEWARPGVEVRTDAGSPPDDAPTNSKTEWTAFAGQRVEAADLEAVDWDALDRAESDAVVLGAFANDPLEIAFDRLPSTWAALTTEPLPPRVLAFRANAAAGADVDPNEAVWTTSAVEFVPPTAGRPFPTSLLPALAPAAPASGVATTRRRAALAATDDTNTRAGLLQMADFLDESHTLAQSSGDRDGDYWHAIMHRREPDPSNSKYWFRRVGDHPVFEELAERAAPILDACGESIGPEWDPFAFVDLCERARFGADESLRASCRRVQFLEMILLLQHGLR